MKHDLLGTSPPEGEPLPPELLEQMARDIDALRRELRAAVFAGLMLSGVLAAVLATTFVPELPGPSVTGWLAGLLDLPGPRYLVLVAWLLLHGASWLSK